MMHWKDQLRTLENLKEWDFAINLMQDVITKNPDDMDAYIYMNYLLMNLLVEKDHDETKHDYYEKLAKKYFDESYAKFSENAEYLFYTGITAVMSEWYFGIEREDYQAMLQKAMQLDPDNLVYKDTYYISLDRKDPKKRQEVYNYAKVILKEDSPIKKILIKKGALGEYLLGMSTHWAQRIVKEEETAQDK